MPSFYLRNRQNNSVVDIDAGRADFHVVIVVCEYSDLLLSISPNNHRSFIKDFSELQELRGEWFTTHANFGAETMSQFITRRLKEIGNKWGLFFVTD